MPSLGSKTAEGKARVPQAAHGGAGPLSSGEPGWWFCAAAAKSTAGEVATMFCVDSSVFQ